MRTLLATLLVCGLISPALADDSHDATAREVVEMMGAVGQARAVVAETAPTFAENLVMFAPNLANAQRDAAQKAAEEEYLQAFANREDEFISGLASVYQELYTEAELLQLKAFYKTPMGAKLANRQRELMSKHLEVIRRIAELAGREATLSTHQRLTNLAPESSQ